MGFNSGFKGLIQKGKKPLCNKKAYDMAIVTNRGTSQIWTTSNY